MPKVNPSITRQGTKMKRLVMILGVVLAMSTSFTFMNAGMTAATLDKQTEAYPVSPDIVFQSATQALPDLTKDTGDERILDLITAHTATSSFSVERYDRQTNEALINHNNLIPATYTQRQIDKVPWHS